MSRLRDSALAVLREATKLSKAQADVRRRAAKERLRKTFATMFRTQGRLYLERLPKIANLFLSASVKEASYDGDLVDAFADVFGTTRGKAEKALVQSLFEGFENGYAMQAGEFGLEASFKLKPEQAVSWARTNAAERITKIDEKTQKEIKDLITRSIDEGRDYGSVAREIRDTFDGFTTSRAETVAVTENAFAYENGTATLVKDIESAGITMEKSWSTIGGDECDICADNEGEGWIDADETFQSGDEHPPAHPNCRCAALYRVKED